MGCGASNSDQSASQPQAVKNSQPASSSAD